MKKNNSSYNQILKSTSIFGGSQAFVIIIGIIRAKIVAVLLGTAGVGIIGIYQSIVEMMRSTCALGMDTAGVKEIAEADNTEDKSILNRTVSRFNKWFYASAAIGFILCLILCYPISIWAFGNSDYTLQIAGLSICVLFTILFTGRSTILQGMRKISEMAKSLVLGSLIGLILSIPFYYFLGLDGIIYGLIGYGFISFLCVEIYYRKQKIGKIDISNREAFEEGLSTLKLGLFIVTGGFVATVGMFVIRAFITRRIDIEAAGLFQSAWMITNVYLALILRSMGSDFFPRLSAIANEKNEVKKLVNEQSYIVLIIASPIIVSMLLFSDFALSMLYSSKFAYADSVLRWQILGTFLKVMSWPITFIILAKNKGLMFLISEIIFFATYLLSTYLLFPKYGLDASGIGYLIAYIVYLPVVFFMGRSLCGFSWNKEVLKMTFVNTLLIGSAFYISQYYKEHLIAGGILMLYLSLAYAYSKLKKVFSLQDLKNWFRKY